MMVGILVLLFCLAAIAFLVRTARGSSFAISRVEELPEYTTPLDLEAFRNLMSEREEEFLRENLPAQVYRRVQRLRLRAGVEYVRRATENAAVLLRLGESARRSPDPEVARAAQQLVSNAVMLRLMGFATLLQLRSRMILPGSQLSVSNLISRYERVVERVALLGRLQAPAAVTQISRAL